MNYISLINQFWAKRLEHSFTPNDIAVYYALADHCNALGWKNPFTFSADELRVKVGLKTKEPLNTARNRLKQAGLIDFKNGDGRGRATIYFLAEPPAKAAGAEADAEKGRKNHPLLSPLLSPLSSPLLPDENPSLHKRKPKPNQTLPLPSGGSEPAGGNSGGESAEQDFATFWQAYDKKVDTQKCVRAWQQLCATDRQAALAQVAAYVAATPEKKYRKNPLTWLHGRCWQDELPTAVPAPDGPLPYSMADRLARQKNRVSE